MYSELLAANKYVCKKKKSNEFFQYGYEKYISANE